MSDATLATEMLKRKFFDGMSYAAATVNVVTTDGPHGRTGVTVSAMSSVSADAPRPIMLVCINENSAAADQILGNGVFCINVLHNHQSYISDVFAGRHKDRIENKFDCTAWEVGATGAPRVADALAAFDCRIVSNKKVGTHYVVFGEVQDVHIAEKGSPLIYAKRSYGSTQPIVVPRQVNFASEQRPQSLAIGCFHSFGPYFLPGMITELSKSYYASNILLVEGENARVKEALLAGEVELALLFDWDLGLDVVSHELAELTPYLLCAEDHVLASKDAVVPEELVDHPMISVAEETSSNHLEGLLRAEGVEPEIIFRASSFEMMRGMVAQGLGYAIAVTRPVSQISYDGKSLVTRKLAWDVASSKVVLARRKDDSLSESADHVWNNAIANLQR